MFRVRGNASLLIIFSVSINDSSSWICSFGPTNSLRSKRSFSRVAPDSRIVINTKSQEDEGCINISPTSSPEGETFELGHQLLSIENLDEPLVSEVCLFIFNLSMKVGQLYILTVFLFP